MVIRSGLDSDLSSAYSQAFTDWLNVSPLGRDACFAEECTVISSSFFSPSSSLPHEITTSSCKPSKTHLDTFMFVANSPTWDKSPFVVKPDSSPKSSATSTSVFAISPQFSRRLLPVDSPKAFFDSDPSEHNSKFSYSDWSINEPYVSPIARNSTTLDVSRQFFTTHIVSRNTTVRETRDIYPKDDIEDSPTNFDVASRSTLQSSLATQFQTPANRSGKKRGVSNLPCSPPVLPVRDRAKAESSGQELTSQAENYLQFIPIDIAAQAVFAPATSEHTPNKINSGGFNLETSCSPLTPLSESSNDSVESRFKRKRKRSPSWSPCHPVHRRKLASQALHQLKGKRDSTALCASEAGKSTSDVPRLVGHLQRTFPGSLNINPEYPLFYRRFPLSSCFQFEDEMSPAKFFDVENPGGVYNPPRDIYDLYTPRFVKGKGCDKVGLCPICAENTSRGGAGKKIWLSMKFSAFKCYHLQYGHGISAVTARPFSPPTNFRMTVRPRPLKTEKSKIMEGKCHKCRKWIAIEGVKNVTVKVKELYWWKHAAACHQGSQMNGEQDFFVQDDVYRFLTQRQ